MDTISFKKLLKNANLTKKELATQLEVSYNTINAWGTNGRGYPYWVKSWLENYVKAKELDGIIKALQSHMNERKDLS